MTDLEFDILDELYFVQTFEDLLAAVGTEETALRTALAVLLDKGWIKCLGPEDDELPAAACDLTTRYAEYRYLATKRGLLVHNGVVEEDD